MADKLLIVHGYSDGSTSFTGLGEFFIGAGHLQEGERLLSRLQQHGRRGDVPGLRRQAGQRPSHAPPRTARRRRLSQHRVAGRPRLARPARAAQQATPAGRCRLSRASAAVFRAGELRLRPRRARPVVPRQVPHDVLQQSCAPRGLPRVGKAVLQGLEPASPFQWELSWLDLHDPATYFNPARPEHQRCYPFVFAAGEAYSGVEARLLKQRGLPGTDGTVRIAGTSLNTRGLHARLPRGRHEAALVGPGEVPGHPVLGVRRLQSRQHHQPAAGRLRRAATVPARWRCRR